MIIQVINLGRIRSLESLITDTILNSKYSGAIFSVKIRKYLGDEIYLCRISGIREIEKLIDLEK